MRSPGSGRDSRRATLPVPRGEGWEHGVAIDYLDHFRSYWLDEFDWAAAQERLNAHPQFTATIEDLRIHFYWIRGRGLSGAQTRPRSEKAAICSGIVFTHPTAEHSISARHSTIIAFTLSGRSPSQSF